MQDAETVLDVLRERATDKSLESRDAGKPARPVRAGGRRKRTCSVQAPRRRLWLRHEVARCEWLRMGGRLMPET